MCEKEYYYYGNSEFMSGLGVIYTEFTGQRASRQINVLNGPSYFSEFSTRDLTLFFKDQEKVLDLHLAEDKVEVRVLENKAKNR